MRVSKQIEPVKTQRADWLLLAGVIAGFAVLGILGACTTVLH